jgi:hypothetical protein
MGPEKRAGMANAIGQELMQIMELTSQKRTEEVTARSAHAATWCTGV